MLRPRASPQQCDELLFWTLKLTQRFVALQATILMILCFPPAVCTSSVWFYYRHETWAWVLQDLLSFALCIQILSLVRKLTPPVLASRRLQSQAD